jgi:transposase
MLRLTEKHLDWLEARIPDAAKNPKGGRPRTNKRNAIAGIFWVLDNGAKWKDLPREFGSKSAVHRAFQRWAEEGVFEKLIADAGRFIERRGGYKLYECFIDAAFSPARGGGDGIGKTKAGKGVKILVAVDAKGLPVAVGTASASPHESTLAQGLFDFMLTEQTPQRVIGDKAYDSDKLDEAFEQLGIEMIAPHRRNRKPVNKTQDGRALRRYKRRWTVERTIAWLRHFRRLCVRWEKSTHTFQAYLHIACTFILINQVLG